MKKDDYYIYGKHAVFSALNNPERKIDEVICIERNTELRQSLEKLIKKSSQNIKLKYFDNKEIGRLIKGNIKHQGVIAKSYKLKIKKYDNIFDKKNCKTNKKYGVILDRLTDPNNIGAIYRSAKAFGVGFVINTERNSVIENNTILNVACGTFDSLQTYITNNISTAIKKFIHEGWWVIGLDHEAKSTIDSIIKKIKTTEKIIFVFGSEGKGIRRLIKQNCNFTARIPNVPNTKSINVSNAAAIVFYELFKMNNS